MAIRRTREQWSVIIRDFERGTDAPTRFCAARGITPTRLRWWQWRLRSASPPREAAPVQMIPVAVVQADRPAGEDPSRVVVVVVCGVEVRVGVGVDIDYVAALVAHLRSQC